MNDVIQKLVIRAVEYQKRGETVLAFVNLCDAINELNEGQLSPPLPPSPPTPYFTGEGPNRGLRFDNQTPCEYSNTPKSSSGPMKEMKRQLREGSEKIMGRRTKEVAHQISSEHPNWGNAPIPSPPKPLTLHDLFVEVSSASAQRGPTWEFEHDVCYLPSFEVRRRKP